MGRIAEGPSFTVPPETWKDLSNNIVKLADEHVGAQSMQEKGFFRVSTKGWNKTFFKDYVEAAVETGTFGQLKYGVDNLSRNVVRASKDFPGWRESIQPPGQKRTATMKKLFGVFKNRWTKKHEGMTRILENDDRHAAELLQDYALDKPFLYGESFSGSVNESPIEGVKKISDLNLPVNIMLLYLRFLVLFHNFVAARGVSGLWTYVYGAWSGTVMHLEDAFLPSINLNMGPGSKMWYFVPRAYYRQVQALYARVGLSPKGDGCSHHFQHKRLAPFYHTLLAAGIPVFYLVQRPGDVIFVDGCVFHEVINWGYGFSQATNILLPSWTRVADAGLYLRSECCIEFIRDMEFSSKALTTRLYALLRRLRMTSTSRKELEEVDRSIQALTMIEWQAAKPQYQPYCVGFGEPVRDSDLTLAVTGLYSIYCSDILPDPKSPAFTLKNLEPFARIQVVKREVDPPASSPVETIAGAPVETESEPVITVEDFLPRRSSRKRRASPCYNENLRSYGFR
ncbi:hypothetical protein BV898_15187 [Hypsibius exemplaris]|uniref:JmjC domain-containing protein n=1 Tax=Hypsibius exemplaris TaxID=2072580 RepID=A0A9X6RK95_HYPEX|nr:hypothetical protein BV898_15187 [Hypsibius exemplaris]